MLNNEGMKRLFLIAVLLGAFLPSLSQASVPAASCFQLVSGISSASTTQITVSATVNSNCTSAQIGNANMSAPVYEIVEESGLLSLGKCNGPQLFQIYIGTLGTVTCTIPINQNFFGSQRTGATSSTIKMWFAWDFSQSTIRVSHVAIPYSCPTNSCASGGSSGGSGGIGASSGGAPVEPVVPKGLEPALDDSALAINQDATDANADASNNAYSESTLAIKAAQDALDAVSALGLQVSALLGNVSQLADVVTKMKKKI